MAGTVISIDYCSIRLINNTFCIRPQLISVPPPVAASTVGHHLLAAAASPRARSSTHSSHSMLPLCLVVSSYAYYQAVRWLQHAKICHNDLKPANVLLVKSQCARQSTWQVKVTDFGSSCIADSCQTRMMTTYAYAAPELLRAVNTQGIDHSTTIPYTFASDMWSIGVILTELLSADASRNMVTSSDDPKYSTPEGYLMGTRVLLSMLGNNVQMALACDEGGADSTGVALAVVMTQPCPHERIIAEDALRHPWFISPTLFATPTGHGSGISDIMKVEAFGLVLARAFCLLVGIRGCGSACSQCGSIGSSQL